MKGRGVKMAAMMVKTFGGYGLQDLILY